MNNKENSNKRTIIELSQEDDFFQWLLNHYFGSELQGKIIDLNENMIYKIVYKDSDRVNKIHIDEKFALMASRQKLGKPPISILIKKRKIEDSDLYFVSEIAIDKKKFNFDLNCDKDHILVKYSPEKTNIMQPDDWGFINEQY